jgi:hypothetical protein
MALTLALFDGLLQIEPEPGTELSIGAALDFLDLLLHGCRL